MLKQLSRNYFFGGSEVAGLVGLQDKREKRTSQIDNLLDLHAKPPKAIIGAVGITDELLLALNSEAGFAQFADPSTKIEIGRAHV